MSTVRVANAQAASSVEFAICLLPAGRYHEFPEDPALLPDLLGFSGWTLVPTSGDILAVSVDFEKPASGAADVHLATRVPPGASNANCWAEWVDIRVRLRITSE